MSAPGYDLAPDNLGSNIPEWCRRLASSVNGIMSGRTNNTDTVTLDPSVTTTTVNLAKGRLAEKTLILFDPLTVNAATELHGGGMYILSANRNVSGASFVITHANNPQIDRSFRYALVG